MKFSTRLKLWGWTLSLTLPLLMLGCVGNPKQAPATLENIKPVATMTLQWRAQLGEQSDALRMHVARGGVAYASASGLVGVLDARTGKDQWRHQLGQPIVAGVGYDGTSLAVVNHQNEVVVLRANRVVWRSKLLALTYTPPLVAGGRVFVWGADRTLYAFDAENGARLWIANRPADALILRQPVALFAFQNLLMVGVGAKLQAISPASGQVQWETSVAQVRGTNDIERLVELLMPAHQFANSLCMRAYQHSIACLDPASGLMRWSQASTGATGVTGNDAMVVGTQSDGRVKAWNRATGASLWTVDALAHRELTAPLLLGKAIWVGDFEGYLHMLSKEDGTFLSRVTTDGSAIQSAPIQVDGSVVVLTQKGGLFAFAVPSL